MIGSYIGPSYLFSGFFSQQVGNPWLDRRMRSPSWKRICWPPRICARMSPKRTLRPWFHGFTVEGVAVVEKYGELETFLDEISIDIKGLPFGNDAFHFVHQTC